MNSYKVAESLTARRSKTWRSWGQNSQLSDSEMKAYVDQVKAKHAEAFQEHREDTLKSIDRCDEIV
jgi:hypothetical protein